LPLRGLHAFTDRVRVIDRPWRRRSTRVPCS